jgi:hypothetical protein
MMMKRVALYLVLGVLLAYHSHLYLQRARAMERAAILQAQEVFVLHPYVYFKVKREKGFNDRVTCIEGIPVRWPMDTEFHMVEFHSVRGRVDLNIDGKPADIVMNDPDACRINISHGFR